VKLATFLPPDTSEPVAGAVHDGRVTAFAGGVSVLDCLSRGIEAPAGDRSWPLADVRLLAPVPAPGSIYCVALNYRAHAAEAGMALPERPVVFLKQAGSSISGFGEVRRPAIVEKLDYEGELVVVIGREGRPAGYAVGNDVSARDLQALEFQWARAKAADTFCPWGPWITTVDDVADPEKLWLRTWVNGELRQDGNTDDLVFGIDRILEALSETADLRPGDIVLTGTPSGIGQSYGTFLQPGDRVRIAVEGLGEIEHGIVQR
jgi:2-keto-4-pentenoate hydratase/2-oxohepta-3-ene-1,7-dioic acid hydratase in catechol pathway